MMSNSSYKDLNLLHIPTYVKQLQLEASEADWQGNSEEARRKYNLASYYNTYMDQNETEWYPKF